nr:MAG TPA: hypothetical protein [Caudoviricetes sp.]
MAILLVTQHFLVRLPRTAAFLVHCLILFCAAILLMLLQLCMALKAQRKNG